MKKEYILQEIVRTTEENSGKPLGAKRFENETGIKHADWCGRYWAKWSDAVREAGHEPQEFNQPYDEEYLLTKIIDLIRELGKFPSSNELRLKVHNDATYPSKNVFDRLGRKNDRIRKIIEYCDGRSGFSDVLEICQPLYRADAEINNGEKENAADENFGFVYLMKSGNYYKVGRSNSADRRLYELNIQMPEKLHLVHKIQTDDPTGIEAYWHARFEDKRKNGEWFDLSGADVRAFKRRKFM